MEDPDRNYMINFTRRRVAGGTYVSTDGFRPHSQMRVRGVCAASGTPTYTFLYVEGSDDNALELDAFLLANQVALEAWVSAGGRLFFNAAPNEGSNQNWGFGGVTLVYSDEATNPGGRGRRNAPNVDHACVGLACVVGSLAPCVCRAARPRRCRRGGTGGGGGEVLGRTALGTADARRASRIRSSVHVRRDWRPVRPRRRCVWIRREGEEPRYTARIVLDGEPTRPRNSNMRTGLSADRGLWSGSTGPGTGWFSASFGPFRRFTGGGREWEKLFYAQPRAGCHLSAFGEDVALTECLLWLQRLHVQSLEQKRDTRLLDSIRRFVNESGLLPHGTRMTQVRSDAVFFEDGSGVQISVDQLSDGFRSVLSMTFEILREMSLFFAEEDLFTGDGVVGVPGVVLIDEIDAHLHPTWQTRIGDWFRDAFPRVQFIVTTHSPLVFRAAEHDTIWRLRAPDDDGELSKIEQIEGEQKARLVYGSVHQALESSGFQLPGIARSERGKEKMHRLAILNRKKKRETLCAEEMQEHAELVAVFPQAASTEA